MGRDRAHQATPDLFSTASLGDTSLSATKQVTSAPEQRHVLPKDLPNSVKHLTDRELDLLITAAVEEAKRRGKAPPRVQTDESVPKRSLRTDHRRQVEAAAVSLTRGQINAVRAAFKAGIKPSLIARQFGISQSDVRKVLASDTMTRRRER
jgi:predicted DNA binding protein